MGRVEEYFAKGCGRCSRFATEDCSTRRWAGGLAALRALCLGAGLSETLKWAHPCYMYAGRNIALLGAFRDDFRLTFFDAELLKDTDGILERPGPNTRTASIVRFTDEAGVAARAPILRAYLEQAKGNAAAGLRAPKSEDELTLPAELAEVLDADPGLAEVFHALTPGRQRSYVIALSGAKTSETRVRRIAGFRGQMLAGKGANER